MNLKSFSPVSNWQQAVGLFLVVVLIVALAVKFGVQAKVNKAVGA